MESANEKVALDIQKFGWQCLHVAPRIGEDGAFFTYSIGLTESYKHPEILIFGLEKEKAHGILTECVDMIKSGMRFPIDEPVADVLAREFCVVFKPIRKDCFDQYLGTAVRYYGHQNFDAYVLFWPDKENCFVWDSSRLSSQSEALDII